MGEEKKTVQGPGPGKDLTSKIATAFRSLPPEEREKPLQEPVEVENPELDKAFDKMVDMYKVRRPERENAVVSFPASPTLRVPRPEPAPQGEEYECPECGHNNPGANQFCGMCGAAREDAEPSEALALQADEMAAALAPDAKHHHHYYHHHHYRNSPYLLVAVVLLLGLIAWQQWQTSKPAASPKPAPPTTPVQVQPAAPVQPQPGPTNTPTTQPPSATPARNTQPKKPIPQSSTRPAVVPAQQGGPPGPEAKVPDTGDEQVAAPPSYKPLTQQPLPALPSFTAEPPQPVIPQPRLTLSREVSEGRLVKRVPPTYPLMAKRAGVQGEVVLRAVIAKDGTVQDVRIVSGNPMLADAAVQAVRQWRYQPSSLDGQPVEAETLVQVKFKR